MAQRTSLPVTNAHFRRTSGSTTFWLLCVAVGFRVDSCGIVHSPCMCVSNWSSVTLVVQSRHKENADGCRTKPPSDGRPTTKKRRSSQTKQPDPKRACVDGAIGRRSLLGSVLDADEVSGPRQTPCCATWGNVTDSDAAAGSRIPYTRRARELHAALGSSI